MQEDLPGIVREDAEATVSQTCVGRSMKAINGGAQQSRPGSSRTGRSGGSGRCRNVGADGGTGGSEAAPASSFSDVGKQN